jgi:hypothetical protein
MSVTMTVAAARVGKIELIDCETLVRDESQNAAEYHATLVPSSSVSSSGSLAEAIAYVRQCKKLLSDTASGKFWGHTIVRPQQ